MDNISTVHPFKRWVKKEYTITKTLFRAIPSLMVAIFCVMVVVMNLMASKIILKLDWIAINGGLLVSWVPFLIMDIVTKHFGAGSANRLSLLGIIINALCALIFYVISIIGVNESFDAVFNTNWFILLGSTFAFILSALVNNFSNEAIGKLFKNNPNGKLAYTTRTYISTFFAQLVDNLAFVIPTYMLFAPIFWGPEAKWSFLQCLICSLVAMLLEFLLEVIFSPLGYYLLNKWKKEEVGKDYFELLESYRR